VVGSRTVAVVGGWEKGQATMPRASGMAGQGRRADPLRVASPAREFDLEGALERLLREQPDPVEHFLAAVMCTDFAPSRANLSPTDERAWPDLVDECRAIVCRQAARYNGRLERSSDGSFVRFAGAYSAVRCALAIRQELHELGVDLRAGLHAAEGSARDGDVTDGLAHVANRICCVAESDRVLTSRGLADLVVGSSLVFDDAGTYLLAGLPGHWQLLSVSD
jgi:class 3 adenylate cyclase